VPTVLSRHQKWPYRVQCSVLHGQDHNWGGQHLRQHRVIELIDEMLGLHTQGEGSFDPKGT
jgi:hypothetical protein